MPKWDNGLHGVHKEIASDASKSVHVLAGPGTGKTYAMMKRVARLLEDGVSPERILVVTFTRNAARDLREQLSNIGIDGAENVKATTLHSLCFKLLSQEKAFKITNRTPRPLLSYETDCLEADMAGKFGGKRETQKLLEAYEAAWARLQHDDPGQPKTEIDVLFETELIDWLRQHQSMLIGEVIPLTLDLLRNNPELDTLVDYKHVLVDEYQDLNKADQHLILQLAKSGSIFVIGDDNQSIYRFRHANPEGIRTFPTTNSGTTQYSITQCRRCPENIVKISNNLISHDTQSSRRTPLAPTPGSGNATVWVVQHATLEDEANNIADYIDLYIKSNKGISAGRICVLTPRRLIGNMIKSALIKRKRNALCFFQEDQVKADAAAEGFCLLTLLVDPTDRAALRAWLGFGSDDKRQKAVQRVYTYCNENSVTVSDTLDKLSNKSIKINHTGKLVERWTLLQSFLAAHKDTIGIELIDVLWPADKEGVEDIRTIASNVAYRTPEPGKMLLELRETITQLELPSTDDDVVQIMSLHKSKGLTRDLVIVAGCMAGSIPFIDEKDSATEQDAQLREQRRLFYVGITRATKELIISSCASMPIHLAHKATATIIRQRRVGPETYATTSFTPFLSELGTDAPRPISGVAWRKAVGLT